MTDRKTPDLGNDRILKLVASFGIPAVVGLMINASYNFVDRIFIGNGVGALGLAGISVSCWSASAAASISPSVWDKEKFPKPNMF